MENKIGIKGFDIQVMGGKDVMFKFTFNEDTTFPRQLVFDKVGEEIVLKDIEMVAAQGNNNSESDAKITELENTIKSMSTSISKLEDMVKRLNKQAATPTT